MKKRLHNIISNIATLARKIHTHTHLLFQEGDFLGDSIDGFVTGVDIFLQSVLDLCQWFLARTYCLQGFHQLGLHRKQ